MEAVRNNPSQRRDNFCWWIAARKRLSSSDMCAMWKKAQQCHTIQEAWAKMSVRNVAWNSSHLLRSRSQKFVHAAGTSRRRSIDFTLEDETPTVWHRWDSIIKNNVVIALCYQTNGKVIHERKKHCCVRIKGIKGGVNNILPSNVQQHTHADKKGKAYSCLIILYCRFSNNCCTFIYTPSYNTQCLI